MLLQDLNEIRKAQTVKFPTHYDVVNKFPQYVKGVVTAVKNNSTGEWIFGYQESVEKAFKYYDTLKEICKFPGSLNWFELSEMYIYRSLEERKPKWTLYGCIVEA